MNSILQLLLNNDKLADILLYSNSALINPESEFKGILTKELINLFKQKYFSNKNTLEPESFKEALSQVNDKFEESLQHDVCNCLSTILEALEEDTNNEGESIVDQIFRHKHKITYICHKNHKYEVEYSSTTIIVPLKGDSTGTKEEIIVQLIANNKEEALVLATERENEDLNVTLKSFNHSNPFETFEELGTELKRIGKIREDSEINVLLNNKRIESKTEIKQFFNPDCEMKIIEIPKPREGNFNLKVVIDSQIKQTVSKQEIRELKEKSQFSIETSKNSFSKKTINRAVKDQIQKIFGKTCEVQVKVSVKEYWFWDCSKWVTKGFKLESIEAGETEFSEKSVLVVELKDIEEAGIWNASHRVIKKYNLQKNIELGSEPENIEGGFPCDQCRNKVVPTKTQSKVDSTAEYNFMTLNKFERRGKFSFKQTISEKRRVCRLFA